MRSTALLLTVTAAGALWGANTSAQAPRPARLAQQAAAPAAPAAIPAAEPNGVAPASWLPDDAADTLYRNARDALNRRDWERAAELFNQLHERHPRSGYAADALYWEAFALYRAGGEENARAALALLNRQRDRHPSAATRGDAEALATRLRGRLASAGDREARRDVVESAVEAVEPRSSRAECDGDEREVRLAALNALQQSEPERALPILRRVLARRDACSAPLREQALYIIAQQAEGERDEIFLEVTRSDPSPRVRELAVYYLSQSSDGRAVRALDEILRTARDASLQEKALYALSQHRSREAAELVQATIERADASERLRDLAIYYVSQEGSRESAAHLRSVFPRLSSAALREKIIYQLAQQGGDENHQWLAGVALDTTQGKDLRKNAIYHLAQAPGAGMSATLAELYDRVRGRELKENLIYMLSQRSGREALDKLIAVAKTEPDRDLRKNAIYHLSQSRDPRATQALLEIIER